MQASIRGVSNNRQLESSLCTTNDDCTDNQWCATTNVENVSTCQEQSQVENEAEENNVDENADTAEENNTITDTAGQNSVEAANNDEADEVNDNADTSKEKDAVNDAADQSSVSPANNDETNEIDEVLNFEPEMDHTGNLNATENFAEPTPHSNSSSSDPILEDEGDITTNIRDADDRPYDHEHSQPHDKTITKDDRSHSNTNSTQQQQKKQPQKHHRTGCTSNVPTLKCKIWDFLDTPPSQYDAHQTISGVVFLAITIFLFAYIIKRRVCPTNPNNGTSRDKKRRYLNADEYAMIAAEYDELLEGAFDHDCDQLTQYDDDDSDEESLQSILSEWSGDGGENDGIEMGDVLGGRV